MAEAREERRLEGLALWSFQSSPSICILEVCQVRAALLTGNMDESRMAFSPVEQLASLCPAQREQDYSRDDSQSSDQA